MYTNDAKEQVFFIAKVFTLQEVIIAIKMTVSFNMPSIYTIDAVDAKSVLS
jgi:hypothetical protein